MSEKRWLATILALYLLLGVTYATTTPIFEASDELWHYPLVRHLADGNPLPVQAFDPALAGPWKQEASQPPLYYYLGAALTFWIDTSDMPAVRLENPHVDNGIITQDGNINLTLHDPEANPWQGTFLAVRIVRLFSVLLGAGTVTLTYLIARQTIRGRSEIALGAAAANAFLPMFLFISGSVNNDNLAILLASLAMFLMIRVVTLRSTVGSSNEPHENAAILLRREALTWLLLGIVIGAGLLTKQGTIGLIPLAWGTAFVYSWQRSQQRSTAADRKSDPAWRWFVGILGRSLLILAIILLPVMLIAGWWYARNISLYGDLLGWNAFIAVLGQRAHPASLAQLWGERRGFLMAYWGLFGGVNVPMPNWIYAVLNGLLLLSVVGFAYYFFSLVRHWADQTTRRDGRLRSAFNGLLSFVAANFGLVANLLFAAAVVIGLIRWATTTWSSQGRLVFTALSSLSVLFMTGLAAWLTERPARVAAALVSTFLFAVAVLAPFLWIAPAYEPNAYSPPGTYVLHSQGSLFGEKVRLRSAAVETEPPGRAAVQPGDSLWVHLEWEVVEPVDRNWSTFVHLVDPLLEQPIAQRDMYPGQGLIPTSWMTPGQRVISSYHLQVPATAIAPSRLEITAGLYDFTTGERLRTSQDNDQVEVGTVMLESKRGDFPNPLGVNLQDELALVGYDLQPRRTTGGETITLTLYWQANRELARDYSIFAQVVGADNTRWASYDLAPAEPTSSWVPGEVHELTFPLILDKSSEPGLYPLIVGAYTRTDEGAFERLQILTVDGRLTEDYVELTDVRID